MIKQSIKNYFKCLKYVFTPLGIIALGLALGLSIAIPNIIDAVSDMCKEIVDISGKSIDFKALLSNVALAVEKLDWSDPMAALGTLFSRKWFYDAFMNNINPVVGDFESYVSQIGSAVNGCISKIIGCAIVVAVFVVIAFIASCFLTRWIIRRDLAKRTVKQFIISTLIGAALSAALLSVAIWLAMLWRYSIIFTVIAGFLLTAVYSLFNAHITHGRKKVPLKSVVNIKNASKLVLSDLIIFAITIAITIIVLLITNLVVGAFVGIGLLIVTASVMAMSADSYVIDLVSSSKPQYNETDNNAEQDVSTQPAEDDQNNNGVPV